MTVAEWVGPAIAGCAVVVSVIAVLYARAAARAAKRSASAAERSAAVAEREEQRAVQDADERAVRWTLTKLSFGVNALTNVGDGTAYDVQVTVAPDMVVHGIPDRVDRLPSGSMMRVSAAISADTEDDTVRVLWRNEPEGLEREWTHPAMR